MRQREALLDLVDLRGERARIGGVALEYLDRHRAAVRRAQQAVDDLQLALLAVAVVAALRQFAAAPLHIARRHVVEHQHAVPQVLAGERRLDRRLALPEPVERDIELVLVDRPQTEDLAKAGSRGERVEHAGGGELGGRRNQPRHDHRDDEVTTTVATRPEQTIESDVAQGAEYGRDMAVRQCAAHHDGLLTGRRDFPALEQRAQASDDLGRPIGQIGDRAPTAFGKPFKLFGHEMAMNQTCYALVTRTGTPIALYCRMREEVDTLVHSAHGSVFDTITTNTFASSRTVLPPVPVLQAFEGHAAPLFQRILIGCQQCSILAALRDTLLPKLVSGELRVKDAEKFIGRAV